MVGHLKYISIIEVCRCSDVNINDGYETIMSFDRVVDYNNYWDILGNYTSDFPVWLNEEFFKDGSFLDPDTWDHYKLTSVPSLKLASGIM